MSCRGQPHAQRVQARGEHHVTGTPFKRKILRGHEWKVENGDRTCLKCGKAVPASPYTKEERKMAAIHVDAPIPYTTEHPWNKPKEESI